MLRLKHCFKKTISVSAGDGGPLTAQFESEHWVTTAHLLGSNWKITPMPMAHC